MVDDCKTCRETITASQSIFAFQHDTAKAHTPEQTISTLKELQIEAVFHSPTHLIYFTEHN